MRGFPEASLKFEKEVEEEEEVEEKVEEKVKREEEKVKGVEEMVEEEREDQFLTKKETSQLQVGYMLNCASF